MLLTFCHTPQKHAHTQPTASCAAQHISPSNRPSSNSNLHSDGFGSSRVSDNARSHIKPVPLTASTHVPNSKEANPSNAFPSMQRSSISLKDFSEKRSVH